MCAMSDEHQEKTEEFKEALTMALYVAICLLAALTVTTESTAHSHAWELIWGTTLGLAIAHWFAFQVSARLVAGGAVRAHDGRLAIAQLVGAVAVAALASIPILLFPASVEIDVVEIVLAGFMAVVGYAVARTSGASRGRAIAYAVLLLAAGGLVVVVKIALTSH
jgi:hypothetical protein